MSLRSRVSRCRLGWTALLALLALLIVVPAAPAAPAGLQVDGTRIADARGGTLILRGGTLIDKEPPGLPAVTDRDWELMRSLGWNSIRLGTNWRFIEPERGVYDTAYLDRLTALAREAMDEGFFVIVDMHQDLWGPPVGDGAPEWTIYPECASLFVDLAKPTGAWAANYLSPWTVCQFTRFWDDSGLQAQFAGAWREVARRLTGAPRLAGYDLFNEPFQGMRPPGEFENRALYPFYERVARAIREVDARAIVFEEPPNSKNVHLPTAPSLARRGQAVYAPHVYGLWDASDAFSERAALVELNMRYSRLEARAMDVPLWYGEFGMRRTAPRAEETLTQIYDIADRQLAGTAYWVWERGSYGPLRPDGSLDPVRALTLSRPYPMRTGGRLERFRFDGASGRFTMGWQAERGTGATLVYVPEVRYPEGLDVEADPGVRWRRVPGRQLLRVTAPPGPHRLALAPPGA